MKRPSPFQALVALTTLTVYLTILAAAVWALVHVVEGI